MRGRQSQVHMLAFNRSGGSTLHQTTQGEVINIDRGQDRADRKRLMFLQSMLWLCARLVRQKKYRNGVRRGASAGHQLLECKRKKRKKKHGERAES